MDTTEIVLALIVTAQVVYQAWLNLRGKKEEVSVERARLLDERWERELQRMELELVAMRVRISVLEAHIRAHNLPLPPTEYP